MIKPVIRLNYMADNFANILGRILFIKRYMKCTFKAETFTLHVSEDSNVLLIIGWIGDKNVATQKFYHGAQLPNESDVDFRARADGEVKFNAWVFSL